VDDNQQIARCYNGLTGASGGACGFSIQNLSAEFAPSAVLYGIDFGFRVDDRFVTVTSGMVEVANGLYAGGATASVLYGYQPTFIGEAHPNSIYVKFTNLPNLGGTYFVPSFTVIVY
jgi:hypothetical protein